MNCWETEDAIWRGEAPDHETREQMILRLAREALYDAAHPRKITAAEYIKAIEIKPMSLEEWKQEMIAASHRRSFAQVGA